MTPHDKQNLTCMMIGLVLIATVSCLYGVAVYMIGVALHWL